MLGGEAEGSDALDFRKQVRNGEKLFVFSSSFAGIKLRIKNERVKGFVGADLFPGSKGRRETVAASAFPSSPVPFVFLPSVPSESRCAKVSSSS